LRFEGCRGIRPPLNSGLMTALSESQQFSAFNNSLPFLFQPWPCSIFPVSSTVLKLWITIMQLQKTSPSFDRKLKETWLNLMIAPLQWLWFYY
jgi:hypothetical protein